MHLHLWIDLHTWVMSSTEKGPMLISRSTPQNSVIGNSLLRKFSFCNMEVKLKLFRNHCYSLSCNSSWLWYRGGSMNHFRICHNSTSSILGFLDGLAHPCPSPGMRWTLCLWCIVMLHTVWGVECYTLGTQSSPPSDKVQSMCVDLCSGSGWAIRLCRLCIGVPCWCTYY